MIEYEPEYAPGEVVIHVDAMPDPQSDGKISFDYLLGALHYGVSPELSIQHDPTSKTKGYDYIVSVPLGEEEAYCKKLEAMDIVESAELRDLAFERRSKTLDTIISMVRDIDDNITIPLSDYQEKLDEIINYMKTHKT